MPYHRMTDFARFYDHACTLPPHDLTHAGPGHIRVERRATFQTPFLQSPMPLGDADIDLVFLGLVLLQPRRLLKEQLDGLVERRLVLFDDHQVVPVLIQDLLR